MSTFGRNFRVTTFGESHCRGVGVIVDGVPPLMELAEADVQKQLNRRRPGQSNLTTPRDEKDKVIILSGTEAGVTLGTPIGMVVMNEDQHPVDYSSMQAVPRPSHADYTYRAKYGTHASSGGGRSSARETIGRVAAGAVAEKWLSLQFGVEIVAWVSSVGNEEIDPADVNLETITRDEIDSHLPMRSGTKESCERFANVVRKCKEEKDSIGGVVTCVCRNIPEGWGEPVFDRLEAMLAHAMLSIPATKGFEVGSGFSGTRQRGSQHNDAFIQKGNRLGTVTNNSGGIQGGISNGEPIVFRVAFKPPATIGKEQSTCDYEGTNSVLAATGRHDPCVVPRAVPIVEAMAALVLADAAVTQLGRLMCFEHPWSHHDNPKRTQLLQQVTKNITAQAGAAAHSPSQISNATRRWDWIPHVAVGIAVGAAIVCITRRK
eukprot:c4587_g1_i1.p1 GENE.c4587_g1_i1~~c4587_g1_i1.p1  ORF type:complete len:432 (-),score=97.75 c4587_g1_i1:16-1311(-)